MTTTTDGTLAFFTAECNRIHDLCDVADVPREYDGMASTMAQRVEILQAAYARLAIQAAGGSLLPFH